MAVVIPVVLVIMLAIVGVIAYMKYGKKNKNNKGAYNAGLVSERAAPDSVTSPKIRKVLFTASSCTKQNLFDVSRNSNYPCQNQRKN